jgi:hypothetical protein
MGHLSQTILYKLEVSMHRYTTMTDKMMACHFINKGHMKRNELVKKNNRAR